MVPCASRHDGALTGHCSEGFIIMFAEVRSNMRMAELPRLRQRPGYDQFLLTHETGHLVGLAHPDCPGPFGSGQVSVMNQIYCMTHVQWNTFVWTLQRHDQSDLNGTYP